MATARYERNYNPEGVTRQLAALVTNGGRVELLGRVRVPILVVHGQEDPLVNVEGGKDTAGCRLEIVPAMGHNIAETLPETIIQILLAHFRGREAISLDNSLNNALNNSLNNS